MPISRSSKPRIVLTLGDPAGIGAEIILKSLDLSKVRNAADFIIVGDDFVLQKTLKLTGVNISRFKNIEVIDLKNVVRSGFKFGAIRASNAKASVDYIKKAFDLIKTGEADVMVTAPISKEAMNLAGLKWQGHTEILASLDNAKKVTMMLNNDFIKTCLVTRHIALKDVSRKINQYNISQTIEAAAIGLKKYFLIKKPKIGVCALNPHAGEAGLFGDEEINIISPAIRRSRRIADIIGPFGADSIFQKAAQGEIDCVICMYHDQALIPLKITGADTGSNVSLGLSFIRVSPLHGTAFDIAGKGIAKPDSFAHAINCAAAMRKNSLSN